MTMSRWWAGVGLVLLAVLGLQGCTVRLWSEWPIERGFYDRLEAVAVDAGGRVHARVRCTDGSTVTLVAKIPAKGDAAPDWFAASHEIDGQWRWGTRLPESVVGIRLAGDGLIGNAEVSPRESPLTRARPVVAGLHPGHDDAAIILLSHDRRGRIVVNLPRPPIKWLSANAIGHVAATPLAVAADVALTPVYVIFLGLWATGVITSH